MNKNIQAILNMLDSNTFQRGVLLDILKSLMHIQELSAHWKQSRYYVLRELVDKI